MIHGYNSDCHETYLPSVSGMVSRMTKAIATMGPQITKMPASNERRKVHEDFYTLLVCLEL